MRDIWDESIARAESLASERQESKELLTFYCELLRAQKDIYEYLRSKRGWLPSGALDEDLPMLRAMMPTLLSTVVASGPDTLVSEAQTLLEATFSHRDGIILEYWREPNDLQFFAKAFLQPYARWLADIGVKPRDRSPEGGENRCPFCGGKPQVSVLQFRESSSESGSRDLICATCLTRWPFKRVACANCGEEDPAKIGYYHTPVYDHVRVEACDSCKHYIKAIDLTRYGFARPLVDEVAAAPLDLWAREQGYTKIELNLLGI